jgi:hypothetical protein
MGAPLITIGHVAPKDREDLVHAQRRLLDEAREEARATGQRQFTIGLLTLAKETRAVVKYTQARGRALAHGDEARAAAAAGCSGGKLGGRPPSKRQKAEEWLQAHVDEVRQRAQRQRQTRQALATWILLEMSPSRRPSRTVVLNALAALLGPVRKTAK